MMNILLLHPKLLFYKIKIYNLLSRDLERHGYRLFVWCTDIKPLSESIEFKVIRNKMNILNLITIIRQNDIRIIINLLSGLSILFFYLNSLLIAKLFSIKTIYYGHGFDLRKVKSKRGSLKAYMQNTIHLFFDRILLYSRNEKKYLWKIHHGKVFVANNSLVLKGYEDYFYREKRELRKNYGINKEKIILFCGRIQKRKRLDVLINIFNNPENALANVALVIVGPGLSSKDKMTINKAANIHYLGPVYDSDKLSEIFCMSDLFCIPGHIGLGLVEAMYWGKPVLTLDVAHAPEIVYLKNDYNGYILKNEKELSEMIRKILNDNELYKRLCDAGRKTYLKEANIDKMFTGFFEVLDSLSA